MLNREDIIDVDIIIKTIDGEFKLVPNEESMTEEDARMLRIVLGEVAMLNHLLTIKNTDNAH